MVRVLAVVVTAQGACPRDPLPGVRLRWHLPDAAARALAVWPPAPGVEPLGDRGRSRTAWGLRPGQGRWNHDQGALATMDAVVTALVFWKRRPGSSLPGNVAGRARALETASRVEPPGERGSGEPSGDRGRVGNPWTLDTSAGQSHRAELVAVVVLGGAAVRALTLAASVGQSHRPESAARASRLGTAAGRVTPGPWPRGLGNHSARSWWLWSCWGAPACGLEPWPRGLGNHFTRTWWL
ncbi:hypothetical protein FB470_002901 [Amycolatopsis thermophila]|uniref:Uncharacterized protein n=1 Tax=Amycolatopsis thermophila TaxID=206084 RepID=A0ABU0EVS0_9PSEU|nr:hypothetical protein [Amycolatopsis thermophila]